MNFGRLRHRITIQREEKTPDGMGGYLEDWVDVLATWADVEPLRGSERYQAQAVRSDTTHRVTLRYRSGISPGMRVLLRDGRTLYVSSVIDPGEMRRELQLECEERDDG